MSRRRAIGWWLRWLWNAPVYLESRHNELQMSITGLMSTIDDDLARLEVRIKSLEEKCPMDFADLEQQLANLRAIVTQHQKDQPAPVRIARRMSEVRAALAEVDEGTD